MEHHPLVAYATRTKTTLTAIAGKARVSRMTLHRIIRGQQNATIDVLRRVSDATDGEVKMEALLPKVAA